MHSSVLSYGAVYYAVQGYSSSVDILMKATQKYFLAVLFIMLYKLVLTFQSMDEILCII